MSHCALKTWLHCLKILMAINNHSLWSWSFPRMPQDNSFLSFSLNNKSSSWSVISGQRSCPHRQTETSCRNNSDGWPFSSAAWTPILCFHGLNNITSSWQMMIPRLRDGRNLPKSSQLFWAVLLYGLTSRQCPARLENPNGKFRLVLET